MVLQIRSAIWLTLKIEVEALHICKPSHHFASTISAFHVGHRPSHPARFLYADGDSRASMNDDVRGHVWTTYAATTRERRWTEPNWRERRQRRKTNAAWAGQRLARRPGLGGNWRRPGLGGDWHARRTSKWLEGKKNRAGAIGEKKFGDGVHTLGLPSLSWTIFRLCKWVWDFANNTKYKIHLQSPLEMLK